jgi:hypothetical protein
VNVETQITNVDSCCIRYNGVKGANDFYYTWRGTTTGGHYTFRQADVGNCIARYGCLSSQYPWVRIYVNGNGAWIADDGT